MWASTSLSGLCGQAKLFELNFIRKAFLLIVKPRDKIILTIDKFAWKFTAHHVHWHTGVATNDLHSCLSLASFSMEL